MKKHIKDNGLFSTTAAKNYFLALGSRPILLIAMLQIIAILIVSSITPDHDYDSYMPNNPMSQVDMLEGDAAIWYGRVEDIRHRNSFGVDTYILILTDVIFDGERLTKANRYVQAYTEDIYDIHIGSTVAIKGELTYYEHSRNDGEFDSYKYYHNRGYLFAMKDARILECSNEYDRLRDKLYTLRIRCETVINDEFTQEDGAILKAMILGVKEEIDSQIKKAFQKNGIAHILAISGLHISFLCMSIYKLLVKVQLPLPICILVCEAVLVLYILMIGISPSSFRAAIMFSFFLIAKILKRSYDMISAMATASIVILLINPGYVYDASYQLSFLAIIAVSFFYKLLLANSIYLKRIVKRHSQKERKGRIYNLLVAGVVDSVLVSISVYLVSLPAILSCYYETSIISILLNLLVIPLMSVLLIATIGCILLTGRVDVLALLLAQIAKIILMLYKKTCIILGQAGIGRHNLGHPSSICIIIYAILLLLICLYCGRHKILVQSIAFVICIVLMTTHIRFSDKLYMLDVGQGDCIVNLRANGEVFIFDCGSTSKRLVGEKRLIPFLKYHGVSKVNGIFISHTDSDHSNGIKELLEKSRLECIDIDYIYVFDQTLWGGEYDDIRQLAKENDCKVVGIRSGYALEDGKLRISCIYPDNNESFLDANDASLVLRVDIGDFSFLETGDIEEAAEYKLIDKRTEQLTDIDILKVAHHGSASSTSREFVKIVAPKDALISVAKKNSYGHPHPDTIDTLLEEDTKIWQTSDQGQLRIDIYTNGRGYRIIPYKECR